MSQHSYLRCLYFQKTKPSAATMTTAPMRPKKTPATRDDTLPLAVWNDSCSRCEKIIGSLKGFVARGTGIIRLIFGRSIRLLEYEWSLIMSIMVYYYFIYFNVILNEQLPFSILLLYIFTLLRFFFLLNRIYFISSISLIPFNAFHSFLSFFNASHLVLFLLFYYADIFPIPF